jgi:hypothetical protein
MEKYSGQVKPRDMQNMERTKEVQMKRLLTTKAILVTLGILVFLSGCAYVSTETKHYLGVPPYPETDPANIHILRSEPTRVHERLGEILLEPQGNPPVAEMEAKAKQEASKMGADAAVIVADTTRLIGAYVTGPWWGRTVSPEYDRVIVLVAIRYTR